MIEPTKEMDLAVLREADGGPRAAVMALLAIVERDYRTSKKRLVQPRQCDSKHEDGTRCERKPHDAGLHVYSDHDAGDMVIW
jgi:hypothetical protein